MSLRIGKMKVHIFETNHAPVSYCGITRSSFGQFVDHIDGNDTPMPTLHLTTGRSDPLVFECWLSLTYCKSCVRLHKLYTMNGTQHTLLPAIK